MTYSRAHGGLRAVAQRLALAGVFCSGALAACQSVGPALKSLAIAFGQDLLAATSVNHSPRYALHLEELLVILARQATGMDFQPQLASSGYRPPPPEYAQPAPGPYGYPPQGGYGQPPQQPGYGYPLPQQPGYGYPSPQPGYGDPSAQPAYGYPGQSADYGYPSQESGYGYPDQGGATTYPTTEQSAGYPDPYSGYRSGSDGRAGTRSVRAAGPEPLALGTALLVQRAGSEVLEQIDDGAVLRDGRGDVTRSDRIKVHFQSNCACYVYVIGIDATGKVARIFPDAEDGRTNPVVPGENYLLPGGSQWWALDDYRGIEQIYFVAAREPRPQIEQALRALAETGSGDVSRNYRAVAEPAIPPPTRGLVKIDVARPVPMPVAGVTDSAVRPTVFTGAESGVDVVVTRWFRHE